MELGHVLCGGLGRPEDLHLSIETVVDEQIVGHANSVGLHGVPLPVVVVTDVRVIVVTDLPSMTELVCHSLKYTNFLSCFYKIFVYFV